MRKMLSPLEWIREKRENKTLLLLVSALFFCVCVGKVLLKLSAEEALWKYLLWTKDWGSHKAE